jgi:hypothetical protein
LLGLHSPQHYRNPIGKFNFGESRNTQFQESNYDDVTHVEYHRVLPAELHSRLHRQCAELLMARGVEWWLYGPGGTWAGGGVYAGLNKGLPRRINGTI